MDFSIGDPDSLSGDLSFTPDGVGTLNAGDFNFGTLSWTGLNTTVIAFGISTANDAALAVDSFSIDASPISAVPLPASALLLGVGLIGFVVISRHKKRS